MTEQEIEDFIHDCEAGNLPELPPMNTAKLMTTICIQKEKIEELEKECERLHSLWHDEQHRLNLANFNHLKN